MIVPSRLHAFWDLNINKLIPPSFQPVYDPLLQPNVDPLLQLNVDQEDTAAPLALQGPSRPPEAKKKGLRRMEVGIHLQEGLFRTGPVLQGANQEGQGCN